MVKTITINGVAYDMKSNAHAMLTYQSNFGTEMLDDIGMMVDASSRLKKGASAGQTLKLYNKVVKVGLQLAYSLILEQKDGNWTSYDNWVKDIELGEDVAKWSEEVLSLVMSGFSGESKGKQDKEQSK